ncbi:hypothetical protein DPEC_G00043330 [Dallia pectoralis]|uniref:Uncharacterized protein n=1 Tax=Dallia pectoralis TaxID=75939 RepID=A0ACC2HAB2_DALPE|nr:hypothetical protein DPEC_G00043330 [Dallia pectoralis]
MLTQRRIDVKNLVSITTDGAPSMMGREKGAVSRLKEDNPELLSYHCIIHMSVLCSTLSEHHAEVMNTITTLVNFLRASSAHQHRLLREFLSEVGAPANDLLLHSNVRWLSKGKVLAHFWKIRNEIKDFLAQQKSHKAEVFLHFLEEESNMDTLAFLVDITGHLNDLNLKLQGKDNSVCDLVAAVQSFQRKLDILKMDLEQDCTHFPSMKEIQLPWARPSVSQPAPTPRGQGRTQARKTCVANILPERSPRRVPTAYVPSSGVHPPLRLHPIQIPILPLHSHPDARAV